MDAGGAHCARQDTVALTQLVLKIFLLLFPLSEKKIIGVKMSIFISHIIITDRRVHIGRKKPYLGGQITIFKNGN